MPTYVVIIEDPSGPANFPPRTAYQIERESEDAALQPCAIWYPQGFGKKVRVYPGVWRYIEESITLVATVIKIDALPTSCV